MRRAYHDQLPLAASGAHHPRAAELLEMGRILDTMTGELAMVCRDLVGVGRKADPNRGREGMTAEQALRAAIVKQMFTVSLEAIVGKRGHTIVASAPVRGSRPDHPTLPAGCPRAERLMPCPTRTGPHPCGP